MHKFTDRRPRLAFTAVDIAGALPTESVTEEPAADEEGLAEPVGTPFTVFIVVEGRPTDEGSMQRLFELNTLAWREPPLPMMIQDRAEHGGMFGDTSAWFGGAITELGRDTRDASRVIGRGRLAAGADGVRAEELIRGGLRGVSVDAVGTGDVRTEVTEFDDEGNPVGLLNRYDGGEILGATVTPHPAFACCTIWFDDELEPERVAAAHGMDVEHGTPIEEVDVFLLAAGAPRTPPRAWFDNPNLEGPTPLTVADDGRLYGHVAAWRTCHTGYPETCVTAPTSPSDYAYFHTGEITCADGQRVSVGQITMTTGHAEEHAGFAETVAHYDHTGTAIADIHVGEDEHGIWAAGAVRHGVTDDQIRTLMAAAPSGDWRRIGGYLELVAVLQVNTPGFPIPRPVAQLVSSGALDEEGRPAMVQQSLVAAPAPRRARYGTTDPSVLRRLEHVERQLAALAPVTIDALRTRVHR